MAASDKAYRNQKTLDVVFGVSCLLLLLSTLWMFVQDYNRQFKSVQRTFRDVEAGLAERELVDRLPDKKTVNKKVEAVEKARDRVAAVRDEAEVQATVRGPDGKPQEIKGVFRDVEARLTARREQQDEVYRNIKAEFDSKGSYFNDEARQWAEAPDNSAVKKMLRKVMDDRKVELDKLQERLGKAKADLDDTDQAIRQALRDTLDGPELTLANAEDDLKKTTGAFDRWAKMAAQKNWGVGDTFRALPIIDGFASPTRINQIWLPDLTIDYGGFKDVPRYDRCTTCHQGIDRATFDRPSLRRLGDANECKALNGKLIKAQDMLLDRAESGEKLGFDPNSLPGERTGPLDWAVLIMIGSSLVGAGALGALTQSVRVGVQTLTIGLVLSLGTGVALAVFAPSVPTVREVNLTPGQVVQYAVHPRLDLFVDSNSPHSAEKFGCTVCHGGQGSATDFKLAAHTPTDSRQAEEWEKEHGWEHSEFWDYPMLSKRFGESSCIKCHHEMTSLIRHGSKDEAPKLLRGYNIVRENGCFGCHEISAFKGGKEIGPDLRLEPTPALDYLSSAEQDRARSDAGNLPGALRKVGPSLRRLAEKTNQDWTRKWILSPRDFRPDTRMPHFYGLSNNREDALPEDQKRFPTAEIHSIAYYLFEESKGYLNGSDTYRKSLLEGTKNLHQLQKGLKEKALGDRDLKELAEVTRRFVDLALLSNPFRSSAINADAYRQRQLQDRLQELHRKPGERTEADKTEMNTAVKELDAVTASLIELSTAVPLAKTLYNDEHEPTELPAKEGNAVNGRRLFTERGCLACHTHQATGKSAEGFPALISQANHGPDLSRLAAKLKPEIGADSARRWLVQWIVNPNVHSPRTRMPVTFLSPSDANDVAAWLLSQTALAEEWKGPDPGQPSTADLVALARVYLAKAPGMTTKDVDAFLPKEGKGPGIPKERLAHVPRDADEHRLTGEITEDKLRWYIGRKAIGRLGCYGCHDVPGYETAKPIGTGLNDWGKKDPERLAFEDAFIYAREHYREVEGRQTRKELLERQKELKELEKVGLNATQLKESNEIDEILKSGKNVWETKDGKEPYETVFYHALEHNRREGFLHEKLLEPRSFDYNRIRPWDERLRMPQFKFARSRARQGEGKEEYEARLEKEEAEAREAVMTFVLGLVAEPMPIKYLHRPNQDKMAEVKGREVLEKFNCGGCHQVRPGLYEFRQSEESAKMLERAFNRAAGNDPAAGTFGNPEFAKDYQFLGHSAWFGTSPTGDRSTLVGYKDPNTTKEPGVEDEEKSPNVVTVRLTDAFRFAGPNGVVHDSPAGVRLMVPQSQVVREYSPYGGSLIDLLVLPQSQLGNETGYLGGHYPTRFSGKPDDARAALPPPLLREGERVQPDWLYKFLLNPKPVRPEGFILLRMPRFNMSPEESRHLVNYFAAASRLTNPGAGTTYPYVSIDQKDSDYWQRKTAEYVKRLKDAGQLDERVKAMESGWAAQLKKDLEEAEKSASGLKKAAEEAKGKPDEAERKKALEAGDARVKSLKEQSDKKDYAAYRKRWEGHEAYAQDAYRLVTDKNLCVKCHNIGSVLSESPQGPNLAMASERLQPGWTEWWIANPVRMFPYPPVMPQNFPNDAQARKKVTEVKEDLARERKSAEAELEKKKKAVDEAKGKPDEAKRKEELTKAEADWKEKQTALEGQIKTLEAPIQFQNLFAGTGLEQTRAARDLLMNLSRQEELPAIQGIKSPPAGK